MTKTTNTININLKTQTDKLFEKQVLPFKPNMPALELSNKLRAALHELDNIEKGKIKVKGYHNVNTFIEDALK